MAFLGGVTSPSFVTPKVFNDCKFSTKIISFMKISFIDMKNKDYSHVEIYHFLIPQNMAAMQFYGIDSGMAPVVQTLERLGLPCDNNGEIPSSFLEGQERFEIILE
jgi:hypothetical protein